MIRALFMSGLVLALATSAAMAGEQPLVVPVRMVQKSARFQLEINITALSDHRYTRGVGVALVELTESVLLEEFDLRVAVTVDGKTTTYDATAPTPSARKAGNRQPLQATIWSGAIPEGESRRVEYRVLLKQPPKHIPYFKDPNPKPQDDYIEIGSGSAELNNVDGALETDWTGVKDPNQKAPTEPNEFRPRTASKEFTFATHLRAKKR